MMKVVVLFMLVIISCVFTFFIWIYINAPSQTTITNSQETLKSKDFLPIIERSEVKSDSGIFCSEVLTSAHDSIQITNVNQDEWELVWWDEFNHDCLDPAKWNIENWAAEKNNELQYYTPTNFNVEDGVLKIISKMEKYRGRDFTSGAIHTQGKFDFLYGKVEMRAKLPAGQGIFPAFWMMANNQETWLPEIDIMEMLGHRPDEIWMVSHWQGRDGKLKSESNIFKGEDFSREFHTFGIEWTQDSITWLIDDVERFKTTTSIPNEKMYLYLNTAIGGNWPGSPDETTTFPVQFEVDYVRFYQIIK